MRVGKHEAVVSVIAPCLDEAAAIGPLVRALLALGVDEVAGRRRRLARSGRLRSPPVRARA